MSKKYAKISVIFAAILSFTSCGLLGIIPRIDKDSFTYKNKFIYNKQIKINGVYVRTNYNNSPDIYGINYFFEDGLFFSFYGVKDSLQPDGICPNISYNQREWPPHWGYYIIEDDILKVQICDPTSMSRGYVYEIEERWAKIVNDTTLHFFKRIYPDGEVREFTPLYQFKECTNKPDSTNILQDNFKELDNNKPTESN